VVAQHFAPEHLQLAGAQSEQLAARVTTAGCVLVGIASGTAFSDYIAGSNHVLPTNGAGRFGSVLSPADFRRRFTEVRIGDGAATLAREAAPIARAEGFELHAQSMEARIRDNGTQ
jgi:histidinol dehydrogenase